LVDAEVPVACRALHVRDLDLLDSGVHHLHDIRLLACGLGRCLWDDAFGRRELVADLVHEPSHLNQLVELPTHF
jgi:hypothetical protein